MAVTIFLPLPVYHGFIGRCKLDSRPYDILRNSLFNHPAAEHEKTCVEVFCSDADAKILLDHAIDYYMPAIQHINEGLKITASASGEYRRRKSGDTWHVRADCSGWPTEDFVAAARPPSGAQLCNECVVKGKIES
jgi:hypothetical protein